MVARQTSRWAEEEEAAVNLQPEVGARSLPPLPPGARVRTQTGQGGWSEPAIVSERLCRRSYLVESGSSQHRRNRRHAQLISPFPMQASAQHGNGQRAEVPVSREPDPGAAIGHRSQHVAAPVPRPVMQLPQQLSPQLCRRLRWWRRRWHQLSHQFIPQTTQ